LDDPNHLRAETHPLEGSAVLRLAGQERLWLVERGSLALFAVGHGGEAGRGVRRFLFERGPGEALFGLPETGPEAHWTVVAVALEPVRLSTFPLDQALDRLGAAAATRAAEAWIAAWGACLGRSLAPPAGGAALERLPQLHAELLRALGEQCDAQRNNDEDRLAARERGASAATRDSLGRLLSVLEPGQETALRGSELFVAAHAVARAAGVTLRPPPPPAGRETRDPVARIAETSHVRVRRVVLRDSWWRQDVGPLLAVERERRRPIALLPRAPGRYAAFEPATGRHWHVDAPAAARLEPEAHVFHRSLPSQPSSGIDLLRFALRGRGPDLALLLGTAAAAALLGMFTPQATAWLVDLAIPDAERGLLVQLGLGLLAAALGAAAFRLSQGIALMRLETAVDAAAQAAIWDRLLKLQLSFFRRFSSGDLQSRVSAVSQIRSHLGGATLRSLFGATLALMNLALLLYYSPRLTAVALAVAAASSATALVSGWRILRCAREILERRGRFFGLVVQLVQGVSKLRIAAAEERAFARWALDFAELVRLELRQRRIQDVVHALNVALSGFGAIALFAVAARVVRAPGPQLSTGNFLAFYVAFGTFIAAVVSLSNTVLEVLEIAVLHDRARPILDTPPEVTEQKVDPGPLAGRLELDHVVFRYRDDGPIVLDDVSLRVEAGQFVALVGPSGSGKSTLLRLLLGFESPASGAIYYDGMDLAGLDVDAVRRQLGVVLQSGRISAGSLFENIVCAANASLNDAWEAARATGLADELAELPMGMHTIVSEGGTNLSGGQRQRLLLARALVQRPRILLLDEATSALDNRTQTIVGESLRALAVTRLVVAHRLSTIREADRIHVLDGGRIVESGAFDELAGGGGLFARLIARQQI
jgi:ATP-binding cassette subfamily C protein